MDPLEHAGVQELELPSAASEHAEGFVPEPSGLGVRTVFPFRMSVRSEAKTRE